MCIIRMPVWVGQDEHVKVWVQVVTREVPYNIQSPREIMCFSKPFFFTFAPATISSRWRRGNVFYVLFFIAVGRCFCFVFSEKVLKIWNSKTIIEGSTNMGDFTPSNKNKKNKKNNRSFNPAWNDAILKVNFNYNS